ncbi:MAG: thioredoxin family protein [SAR86 cluster bacterium]|uniref:Thioredoxin family protein n=1 Tax=SAR86 cluster bacterium TaxID=2030880 RepID=A0A2A5BB27_9GAMM|nr:MAG: thioredoxin family protein [SAR86 cluster bacterium]
MQIKLILYTTAGCHLCEQAEKLLEQLLSLPGNDNQFEVLPVDISLEERLVDLYGIRIPVVKNELSGKEIGWPFELSDLAELLKTA